jgi:hypothetical protein
MIVLGLIVGGFILPLALSELPGWNDPLQQFIGVQMSQTVPHLSDSLALGFLIQDRSSVNGGT